MALRVIRSTVPALLAALALVTLLAVGPQVERASAATACQRFADTPTYEMRKRPARRAVRCLLNRHRSKRGLARLRNNRKLQRAAQKHTNYMHKEQCFAHECPGERSLEARLRVVDYLTSLLNGASWGENIAYCGGAKGTPRQLVHQWMHSPSHRANVLNPTFTEIGIGVVGGVPVDRRTRGGTYTTDFGMRR